MLIFKTCTCCNVTLPIDDFPKHSQCRDGHYNQCRSCRNMKIKDSKNNPESKARKAEADRRYRDKNKDILTEAKRDYYLKNKESLAEKAKERYLSNPEPTRLRTKSWKENNRGKHNSNCMMRHARKLNATPEWLDEFMLLYIDEIYDKCSKLSKLSGNEYHVDHIVPLQGTSVCGLHVPWNLQILSASDNCSKQNSLPTIDELYCKIGWKHVKP